MGDLAPRILNLDTRQTSASQSSLIIYLFIYLYIYLCQIGGKEVTKYLNYTDS
jgi:hypothetical protein